MAIPRLVPALDTEPADATALRAEVRAFLDEQRAAGTFTPAVDAWLCGWDEKFTTALAARGWLGMTVPKEYGGQAIRFCIDSWSPRNFWPRGCPWPRTGSPTGRSSRRC